MVGLALNEGVVNLRVGERQVEHAGLPEGHLVELHGLAVDFRRHLDAETHFLHALRAGQADGDGVALVDDMLVHLLAAAVKADEEVVERAQVEPGGGKLHHEAHALRFGPGGRAVEDKAVRALHAHDAEVAGQREARFVFAVVLVVVVEDVVFPLDVAHGEQRAAPLKDVLGEFVGAAGQSVAVHQGRAAGRGAGLGAQLVADDDRNNFVAAVGSRGAEVVTAGPAVQVGHVAAGRHLHLGALGGALNRPRHAQLGVGFELEGVLLVAHVGVERRVDGAVVGHVGLLAHEAIVDADGAHAHREHGVEAQLGGRERDARRDGGHALAALAHPEAHGLGREGAALHLVAVGVEEHDVYPRAHVEAEHIAEVIGEADLRAGVEHFLVVAIRVAQGQLHAALVAHGEDGHEGHGVLRVLVGEGLDGL